MTHLHELRGGRRLARQGRSLQLALAALLTCAGTVNAGTAPAPADEGRTPVSHAAAWRPLAIYGGDIRALAIAPDDPEVALAGTSAGQVYISRDGGASWSDAGAPLPFPGWVVSSLHFDPNRHERLWASLWGIWGSGSVASSDDLGKSWSARAQGLPDEPVYTVALAPAREGRLYAATLSGVYGSEDSGASWRHLTADLPEMQKVTSLTVDPNRPERVIAGTWRQAYRSEDGGKTWTGIFDGMVLDTEVFSLTPLAGRPGEIWASTCGWVYQTVDHGDHWQRFKDGLDERRTTSFAVLPGGRLLAGTVSGIYVSDDSGRSWKLQSDPALSASVLASHPARPDRVLVGTEGAGVWVSRDGGTSFYRSTQGITNLRVGALALAGSDLLVAVNHAGAVSGLYATRDRGRTAATDFWPLPTVTDIAARAGHVYVATVRGLYERRGNDWFHLPELGTSRVEQLTVDGEQVLARTDAAVFELRSGHFVQRPSKHGPPRSAVWYEGAFWVSDAQGLYSITADANHPVATPQPGGRLLAIDGRLLLSGTGGAWARDTAAGVWLELTSEPSRLLATGDPHFGALLVSGDVVRLYDRDAGRFRTLEVPFPARDIAAAAVVDGRLLLGTSGYGVLERDLEALP